MEKFFTKGMLLSLLLSQAVPSQAVKVHTIGDSTMQTYDESATVTRGWGQYFQQFFQDVTINNRGKAGASSKSFYLESAYWNTVKQQMQPGDYVLIQFAHNDEKNNGVDGDSLKAYYTSIGDATTATATDYRGTTPGGSYKAFLRKYVEETRMAGCNPVLVSPICRMYFSGNTIRRNGQHDLGDSFDKLTSTGLTKGLNVSADDNSMDYVYQMKMVAEEENVPFIDLMTATKNLYLSYGDTKCHELLGDGNGSTHLNTTGATLIARTAAQLLKDAGILADNIVLNADLSVSPAVADLGEAYKGQTLTKEFSLCGFSLSPANGQLTISASNGILVSTDQQSWAQTATLSYTDGTLVKSFYAKVELNQAGVTNGTITIQQSSATTLTIPVSATAITLEGGTEVKAYWRLESDDSFQLEGPATVIPESWQSMYVQRYQNPNAATVWPDNTGFDATRKTQRNLIQGDVWPANEIDEVSTRYIQFGITPSNGTNLKIDSIGLYVCGCGGNGMQCHINYSTEKDFANQHTIFSPVKMVANNMMEVTAQPVISLAQGDTLLLRIYPWYNGTATGKTFCISDVTFHGMAIDALPSAIETIHDANEANADPLYYTLAGIPVANPQKGTFIHQGKIYIKK